MYNIVETATAVLGDLAIQVVVDIVRSPVPALFPSFLGSSCPLPSVAAV